MTDGDGEPNEMISQIQEDVRLLKTWVGTLDRDVADNREERRAQTRMLNAFRDTQREHSITLREIAEKVGSLTIGQVRIIERVDALTTGQTILTERVDALTTGQTILTERVDALETKVGALDTKVGSIATGQGELLDLVREVLRRLPGQPSAAS